MLRINENTSASGARSYYSTADYYSEGQELTGVWRGEGAKRLGLSGEVNQQDWDALCENRHPVTGEALTPRQNRSRRVGYDFNFHVPKSVSILYGLTQDERILEAFRESVDATMQDMEAEMKTRVRVGGKNEDRVTGNMVWGEFIHTTARPVDEVPDPHVHAHCFVQNVTWDEREERWKAGQFADLKREAPFFEAVFHARLARRLEELGLAIQPTKRGWELAGMPTSAIKKFSRRTALIEERAKESGITDPELKGELGAKTRERKRKDLGLGELRQLWQSKLSPEEREALKGLRDRVGGSGIPEDDRLADEGVARAIEHCFERSSVIAERKLLTEALKRSYGAARPETVIAKVRGQGIIIAERDGQRLATTRQVLDEEQAMIDFARDGRGTCKALGADDHVFAREWLSDEQRRAVIHLLTSPDRVILLRGGAGTGKTSMMQEAVAAIEQGGKNVFTFAPSADASRGVLRGEGFANADTVARLLVDRELQASIRDGVIWVDEAGLLGARQMRKVFDLAQKMDARIILSGDTRQHHGVERGEALKLLETEAGLVPAELREIKRQKDEYKRAVEALSEGRTEEGVERLDKLGWIEEASDVDRYKLLARDYVGAIQGGKSALVVSPTHLEGEWVTDEIRGELKRSGQLSTGERRFIVYQNANLTEAERAEAVNYEPGDMLEFHQNARGHRKGDRVILGDEPPPLTEASRFQVYRPNILPIAPGERIRVTKNGKTLEGAHTLNNGALFTVRDFDARGNIVLTNGWKIARDYGHLAHGYVVTSHASQGKTVDRVFVGMSEASLPASSREQFYVSVSRGREAARIYCSDKESLLQAVSRSDSRLSATELLKRDKLRERSILRQRMELLSPEHPAASPEKEQELHRALP